MHKSVSTLDGFELINLQPLEINPLMSSCQIKVMYIGENRNGSSITEEVAVEMAKTLRGCPIVGYYSQEKQDFRTHSERVTIDDDGINFQCLTVPYGFVAPNAEVWFENFEDFDEFGNSTTHKYLMTTGYLWTGQFEEAKKIIEEGRPQSMELDSETLDGHWATNYKNGVEFFIINDATFSKLCILGDDVEPCFEGANITAKQTYSLQDNNFAKTLHSMMQDLKFALEGGQTMSEETQIVESEVEAVETDFAKAEDAKAKEEDKKAEEEYVAKKEDDKEEAPADTKEDTPAEDDKEEAPAKDEEKDKKYALLEEQYNTLNNDYSDLKANYEKLEAELKALNDFKLNIENEQKDALIQEFYMLDDADKADVITNKEKYTLDEIKSKLSVICFEKKISFAKEEAGSKKEEPITYNLNEMQNSDVPDFVTALKNNRKKY